MSFTWPAMLLSLVLVPLLVVWVVRMQQRRRKLALQFGSLGFRQGAAGSGRGSRRYIPQALYLAGLTILLVALARPQAVVSLPRLEGTIILAFDVSGSMAAEDFAPNRMEAAKTAARSFVERLPSGLQVGIVAFSDGGFTIQAPTDNQEDIFATINRLAPERGTSLGQGILASLNTIAQGFGQNPQEQNTSPEESLEPSAPVESYESAVIVLLSDGENNMNPDPFEAAQKAAEHGVRIYTIGIGSPAGATINIDGFMVHTQLDEGMLQGISDLTGGEYFNAENEGELQKIYGNLAPQLVVKPEKIEITSLLVGASLLVLLVGSLFSLLWFSRIL